MPTLHRFACPLWFSPVAEPPSAPMSSALSLLVAESPLTGEWRWRCRGRRQSPVRSDWREVVDLGSCRPQSTNVAMSDTFLLEQPLDCRLLKAGCDCGMLPGSCAALHCTALRQGLAKRNSRAPGTKLQLTPIERQASSSVQGTKPFPSCCFPLSWLSRLPARGAKETGVWGDVGSLIKWSEGH
jgi:hypothetical protein